MMYLRIVVVKSNTGKNASINTGDTGFGCGVSEDGSQLCQSALRKGSGDPLSYFAEFLKNKKTGKFGIKNRKLRAGRNFVYLSNVRLGTGF